jgi:hypothetical protein
MYIKLVTATNTEVPLKDVKLETKVCENISQCTMMQRYFNDDKNPIEAFYTFPTPSHASVYDFTAQIGDKVIKTQLKDKEAARKEYNEAMSKGNSAYLMERVEGDVFNVCLGNVPPQTEVTITIRYAVELKNEIDCSQVRISIPLTIMPRFTSKKNPTDERMQHGKLVNPTKVNEKPYNMTVTGTITQNSGIVSLDAKTTKMKMSNMQGNKVDFEINDLENLDEDIIITVTRNKPNSVAFTQEATTLPLTNNKYKHATMINVIPNFTHLPEVNPADASYAIILDRSGSMEGADLENCKKAAELFVSMLPMGSIFDVYHFGSDFEKFKLESGVTMGTIEAKQKAIEWIQNIKCDGGTEIYDCLVDAYASIKSSGKNGVLVFLSDGGIENVEGVLKLIGSNKGVSVFTIGIGKNVSRALIQGMADEGHAVAEYINSGSDQIKDKVVAQLNRAKSSLRKLQKDNVLNVNVDGSFTMIPETLPTLFENDVNTVYVLSESPLKDVSYTQTHESYNCTQHVELKPLQDEGHLLHRMAGVKLMESLYNKKDGSQLAHLKQDLHKDEIVEISNNLGVLSKYTSFIGVEYRTEQDKVTGNVVVKEVPLQMPKKYRESHLESAFMGGGLKMMAMSPSFATYNTLNISNKSMTEAFVDCISCDEPEKCDDFGGFDDESVMAPSAPRIQPKSHSITLNNRGVSGSLYQNSMRHTDSGSSPWSKDTMNLVDRNLGVTDSPHLMNLPDHLKLDKDLGLLALVVFTFVKKLLNCILLGGSILTSKANEVLPFIKEVKVNDIISLKGNDANDGVYKIIDLGSENNPWVLEKLS